MSRPGAGRLTALAAALLPCLGGCMVLSHDTYFSPRSLHDHQLRSPFPGNPWNQHTIFGAPADIITLALPGLELGLSIRTSATSFAWIGPVFVPLVPLRRDETLQTDEILLWLAVKADQGVALTPSRVRVRLPNAPNAIEPSYLLKGTARSSGASLDVPLRIAAGERMVCRLAFALPRSEGLDGFSLEIEDIRARDSTLAPVVVAFSRVRGWRVLSLP